MDGNNLVTTLLSDQIKPTEVNLVVTAENIKGMTSTIYESKTTLNALRPQEFYLMTPKKLTRKLCKKKALSHFTITIKEGLTTIFETSYYPSSNATVDFPRSKD